jgi:hypothetical protein
MNENYEIGIPENLLTFGAGLGAVLVEPTQGERVVRRPDDPAIG